MLMKETQNRQAVEMVCTDMLVPGDHLLRKIDRAVDFRKIYGYVEGLYSADNGRPGVDPVVLFKMALIQHLYGIRSLRQTVKEIELNVGYRWFLGYTMNQGIPHFATLSYAFCQRFGVETVEEVFRWILEEAAEAGLIEPDVVFVDATHIKANANLHRSVKAAIPRAAKQYSRELMEEVNRDRAEHGKEPFDGGEKEAETRTVTVSASDPQSGLFHKGEHRKCFAYGAHTACDRHNFILEVEVAPGNVHDSVVFDTVYGRLKRDYPQVAVVTMDAGYKTPWICKQVFDDGKVPSLPYRRPMTKKGNLPWHDYVYDEYYDCVLCPQDKVLEYATTNREGYQEFRSDPRVCERCSELKRCTANRKNQKTVTRHVWQDYIERAEDVRHSPLGRETYGMRSQTIERVFADAKEKHAMRYTYHRGLNAVSKWVKLKFAAMNLKKLAMMKWRKGAGNPTPPHCPSPLWHLRAWLLHIPFLTVEQEPGSAAA
jgi:transposase